MILIIDFLDFVCKVVKPTAPGNFGFALDLPEKWVVQAEILICYVFVRSKFMLAWNCDLGRRSGPAKLNVNCYYLDFLKKVVGKYSYWY